MNTQPHVLNPVRELDRIISLDVLRGFALLGILIMNVQSYSMPGAAYFFPTAYGDLTGTNYLVWYLSELLARRKFMTIFSMLFGAGILLMYDRAAARDRGLAGLHYRRMGVLWLIGMIHAYIFWDGDILVAYAVCGLVLFLFRRVRPGRLLITSIVFLAIGSASSLLLGWSAQYWPEESLVEFRESWLPNEEMLATQISNMRGGWVREIGQRWHEVLQIHLFWLPFHLLWRAAGCMLLGMALYRWGVFSARSSRRFYVTWIGLALIVGIPLTALGTYRQIASGWEPVYAFFTGSQYAYWASPIVALGYVGIMMLVVQAGVASWLTRHLAAVGQMALTNYLVQTLICTTIFDGHGFGLYGQVDRVGQLGIVLVIWLLQLTYSPLWLRHYQFGPAEWVWRSLSYRCRQPWRRQADSPATRDDQPA